jgi:hypothetical protein
MLPLAPLLPFLPLPAQDREIEMKRASVTQELGRKARGATRKATAVSRFVDWRDTPLPRPWLQQQPSPPVRAAWQATY